MGGAKAEINLAGLLSKRQQLIGSTLRARSNPEKKELVEGFLARFGARLQSAEIAPVVDQVFMLSEVAQAHRVMKASSHFGKLLLAISS